MYRTKDINQKETKIQKKKVFELIKKKSKKIISKNNECDIEYVIQYGDDPLIYAEIKQNNILRFQKQINERN